jgi:hypothetical protein
VSIKQSGGSNQHRFKRKAGFTKPVGTPDKQTKSEALTWVAATDIAKNFTFDYSYWSTDGEETMPDGCAYLRYPQPANQNPKPEIRNPKPENQNPKPETRNPKPEFQTQNPKPETQTRNPKPEV